MVGFTDDVILGRYHLSGNGVYQELGLDLARIESVTELRGT